MKFESRLATRVAARKDDRTALRNVATFAGIIFIVLTLTASTLATPQAVIQLGSKNSVANYLGHFDGKANVVMLGALSSEDWVSIKVPFKGHISDLASISFSEFVEQTGGSDRLEPYVILKLPEGRSLVCKPEYSYSTDGWFLPYFSWQTRDTVSHGKWTVPVPDAKALLLPLSSWTSIIGDQEVISVTIVIGGWSITQPYQCYLGDLAINGKNIDIANAGRATGNPAELPLGF